MTVLILIWLSLGALLMIIDNRNFTGLENYLVSKYRSDFQKDITISRLGWSRGHIRPFIILGIVNPHPNDKTYLNFVIKARLLYASYGLWFMSLFLTVYY